jgi:hypothetical protein
MEPALIVVVLPQVKTLRRENKALKQELNRKDKALAETAALLVLIDSTSKCNTYRN